MSTNTFWEKERMRLDKLIHFRLPHYYKKVGIALIGLSIAAMVIHNAILDMDSELNKTIMRYGMIIGMLLISIAKDKVEDEMTAHLRAQSYSISFILAVLYACIMPIVETGVDQVLQNDKPYTLEISGFQILIYMLLIQIAFYHQLKRMR